MTPEELTRLKELEARAPQGPLKVRIGYMAGERATIDITTIDEQYPPLARLWAHPLMDYEQVPPNEAVVEKLVGSYNALSNLLAEINLLKGLLEHATDCLGRIKRDHPEAYEQALAGDTQ